MSKKQDRLTLGMWLINKINTAAWRAGKVHGSKHPKIDQKMIDTIGKNNLMQQARELEQCGIITAEWTNVRTEIKQIHISVEKMDELCRREGVENPQKQLAERKAMVQKWRAGASVLWLLDYYDYLLARLEKGEIPVNTEDEKLFCCLNGIAGLERDTWKRIFSTAVFGDSKLFQNEYQDRILTVLKDYSPKAEEGMTDNEILAEHRIITYSQTLEWKGDVVYQIEGGSEIDTAFMPYGSMINAQTLVHAQPVSLKGVQKIITIENKANYESMPYNPKVLYIYTHGFFSPKERTFLAELRKKAGPFTEFYHWGDMDYGGIRIFQFIRQNVFPKLQPLYMGKEDYRKAIASGAGIPLELEKRRKLEKIEAGELEELRQCILKAGMEIEQEVLLAKLLPQYLAICQ